MFPIKARRALLVQLGVGFTLFLLRCYSNLNLTIDHKYLMFKTSEGSTKVPVTKHCNAVPEKHPNMS
jgi:hypothetical protein